MSHFGKELDKFVATYLGAQKNAREAALNEAHQNYYNALADKAGHRWNGDLSAYTSAYENWRNGNKGNTSGDTPDATPSEAGAWWTPERQSYAANYLVKNAGLSEYGAAGLVARWAGVESSKAGPLSVNPQSGAFGVGQWLGDRRIGIEGNKDFDAQLAHAAKELTPGTEEFKRAGLGDAVKVLRTAKSENDGARGASMYERAEGYDAKTGNDNFTSKTPVASVYKTVFGGAAPSNGPTPAFVRAGQKPPKTEGQSVAEALQTKPVNMSALDISAPASVAPSTKEAIKPDAGRFVSSALPVDGFSDDSSVAAASGDAPLPPRRPGSQGPDVAEAVPSTWAPPKEIADRDAARIADEAAAAKAAAEKAKLTEGWKSPQATLEDEYLPDDSEFAAKGGMIGRSKGYPLHHVVGEAMSHMQNMYGLNASNGGAIQDPAYAGQVNAFLGNSRAPSPEAMKTLLARHSSDREPIAAAMRGVYAHFADGGDVGAAREAVAGVLQGARREAMDYGRQAQMAHEQGDHSTALQHLAAAYNSIPDGHSFTGEVNHNGFGRGQFINHETGQPIQQVPLTPDVIRSAAQNFSSGAGFYPHLAYAMEQREPVKKFEGGGLYNLEDADAAGADYGDQQDAYDAALAGQGDSQPEAAIPTQISDQAIDEQLTGQGWKPSAKPPEPPPYIPLHPDMDAGQRAAVQNLNQRMFNEYRVMEAEYKQQAAQDLAKERIGIRQKFQADQAQTRQQNALEKEGRTREAKIHANRMKTNSDYAFQNYNSDLINQLNETKDDVQKAKIGHSLLDARYAFEADRMKTTAKERDPEQIQAVLNDVWDNKLSKISAQDRGARRADGSPMTDVSKRGYYNFDGLPEAKNEFMDIMYGVLPANERGHNPQAVMSAVHDMAFKQFKDPKDAPQINPNTGKVEYGGISLLLNSEQMSRIKRLRQNAMRLDNEAAGNAQQQRQQAAAIPQQRAEATSMRPTDYSADQQYAIKYGLSPNASPEEVDRVRRFGAF